MIKDVAALLKAFQQKEIGAIRRSGITHLYPAPRWYGRDLSIDKFTPLLWGKAADNGDVRGWEYWEHPVSAKDLKQLPALTKEEWQAIEIL